MSKYLLPLLLVTTATSAFANNVSESADSFEYPAAPGHNIPAAENKPYPGVMKLKVDATDIERAIFSIEQTIPVASTGDVVILFPQWLPGNHAPRGQIEKILDLDFIVDGKPVQWTRDSLDVFAFHIPVPAGAKNIVAKFKFASATEKDQGRIVMAPQMLNLQPNSVSFYPAGYYVRQIPVEMEVKYPAGWQQAGALKAIKRGDTFVYERTNFETLVDSPIFAGKNYRRDQLSPTVAANWFADDAKDLAAKPDQIEKHKKLVAEAKQAFGMEHFDRYEFLTALTDEMGSIGLEHHRSSENGVNPGYFLEWDKGPGRRNLLPHEYAHSWAGKYRRPAGMATPDYRTPMQNNLLWAYEGIDQFYGYVLGARSGLFTKQQTLDALASIAASLANRKGRDWRALEDTTHDPIISARRPKGWVSMQRSEDYYNEGLMIRLEADSVIRAQSKGKKSIDDFAKIFYGGTAGDYQVRPFVFADVVAALNETIPYDWANFLDTRVNKPAPILNLNGLTNNGYRLVYTDKQSEYLKSVEDSNLDLSYSLGMGINKSAEVTSVMWDGVAFNNGITTGTKILAVGDKAYSKDAMKAAITEAKANKKPIRLITQKGDYYRTLDISYFDGLRYPALEKLSGGKTSGGKSGGGESGLDLLLKAQTP